MMPSGESAGTPRDMLRAIRILCYALIIGVVFFTVIIVLIHVVNGSAVDRKDFPYKDIFLYVAAGIAFVCLLMANKIYNRKLRIVKNAPHSLAYKLNQYRTALISYLAPCEGAALFSGIVFFLTAQYVVLIITAVMLAAMMSKIPLQKKVINELDLDWKEQEELFEQT